MTCASPSFCQLKTPAARLLWATLPREKVQTPWPFLPDVSGHTKPADRARRLSARPRTPTATESRTSLRAPWERLKPAMR
jgi:hypothetical protein